MKICIIAEGCYPYVVGGVSSWLHNLIKLYPNVEFSLVTILANRDSSGSFKYDLPENLTEVYETYLNDVDWAKRHRRRKALSRKDAQILRSLVLNQDVDWDQLFELLHDKSVSVNDLLMGPDFLHAVQDCYDLRFNQLPFTDFLWTIRSIYLPMFLIMKSDIPAADIYHCVSTGYAGVLGCMGKHFHNGRLLLSEHGIYTREREEEIIKAKWVQPFYKDIWIEQFHKMSRLTYDRADRVTSLFERARVLQLELGCSPEKALITPNGIHAENFANIPGKTTEDEGRINVGAIMRVCPIKDVKTLVQAFSYARSEEPRLKLWIMGPWDEEMEYAQECFELVEAMKIPDVIFTGTIDVRDYLGRMDMTILSSISEGQPLTILESFAAKKPVIATDVGNCRGLIFGEGGDTLGRAGILTHIMDAEGIAQAILTLARNPELRTSMGEIGCRRVMEKYQAKHLADSYRELYRELGAANGLPWPDDDKPVKTGGEKAWQESV